MSVPLRSLGHHLKSIQEEWMKIHTKTIQTVTVAIFSVFFMLELVHAQGFYAGINIGSSDFDGSQFGKSEIGWGA